MPIDMITIQSNCTNKRNILSSVENIFRPMISFIIKPAMQNCKTKTKLNISLSKRVLSHNLHILKQFTITSSSFSIFTHHTADSKESLLTSAEFVFLFVDVTFATGADVKGGDAVSFSSRD